MSRILPVNGRNSLGPVPHAWDSILKPARWMVFCSLTSVLTNARLRFLSFAALVIASAALALNTFRKLAALSISADPYSYILLIPVISALAFYVDRRKIFADTGTRTLSTDAALLAGCLTFYVVFALGVVTPPGEYVLSIRVLSVTLLWAAAFALCYGVRSLRAARFPFLLLLLLVPLPLQWMDNIVGHLQRGSADITYALFRLAGIPMFRTGVRFELPIVNIEIAKECSSVHSACALFITGLLVGHMFLRSLWTKTCLTLLTIPIAMLGNAVRIVTLWFLATRIDIGFLSGNLHRRGGIFFSLVSLAVLTGCVSLLRKADGRQALKDAARSRSGS